MNGTRRAVVLGWCLAVGAAGARAAEPPLLVTVTPWGPSTEVVEAARRGVLTSLDVRRVVGKADVAMVSFELVEARQAPGRPTIPPNAYRALLVDYTRNRAYEVTGALRGGRPRIELTDEQPEPDDDERSRALAIVTRDPELGPAILAGRLLPYPPMPPLVDADFPVGAAPRTVALGLAAGAPGAVHEIVGVDMINGKVVRYQRRAPVSSRAEGVVCGPPNASQPTTSRGTAGQMTITITKGGQTIWSMLAIRPAVSSGTRASGVELKDVFYRNKKVFARAHVPILNVHYDGDACGPYRDWQWQEGMFVARGRDVVPGVRVGNGAPPESMVDNGSDNGNFRGLAIYVDDSSVHMVSEMQAGWYRYVSQWTFDSDGTIHPRFGFAGVSDSCICNIHHHNAYWRFDFDVAGAANNQIYEITGGTPVLQTAEFKHLRAPGRTWKVQSSSTGEAYTLVPGADDGIADTYAKADAWGLVGKGAAELDDGINCTTCAASTIQIDTFIGPEALTASSDVVVWYGVHFDHDINDETLAEEPHHMLGPDLVPSGW